VGARRRLERPEHACFILDKEAYSPLYWPGQVITYTLTITHYHPSDITYHVALTDTIPANTTFITATLPHTLTTDTIEWGFPVMTAGEARAWSWSYRRLRHFSAR